MYVYLKSTKNKGKMLNTRLRRYPTRKCKHTHRLFHRDLDFKADSSADVKLH